MKFEQDIINNIPDGYELSIKAARAIARAKDAGIKTRFSVLSCPDYTSKDDKYTFGELGEDVPLLTRLHSKAMHGLMGLFWRCSSRARSINC